MKSSGVPAKVHLDAPLEGIVLTPVSAIHGWVADEALGCFDGLRLVNDGGASIPLRAVDRPDVRAAIPNRASTGFSGWIDVREAACGPWRIRCDAGPESVEAAVPLRAELGYAIAFAAAKARKLAHLRALLRCPHCRGDLHDDGGALRCPQGHGTFAGDRDAFDFLTDAIRTHVGAVRTDNVSAHGYDATLRDLIAASTGPVLDVGAGLRHDYLDDVINLDIVAYPTTDVVAASELLPFADDTFGLVISVAVLEHVRDPFAAARELERVIRPGGRIFAAVPFLQPYHGYPDHYYNMTSAGLRNLFSNIEVEQLEVPASGHPIFALTWMLKSWREGLPAETRDAFDAMTVADLATDPMGLFDQAFVSELSAAMNTELAALNLLIGRKRG